MNARPIVWTVLLFATAWSCAHAQDAKEPKRRLYSDGPLTAADFLGKVPDQPPATKTGVKLLAYTMTDIYYNYRYQFQQQGNVYVAWPTEVTFTAQFLKDESWNQAPKNLPLLAHEQGHFDITEIFTWRSQQAFDKLLAKKAIFGRGATEEEAREAMVASIRKHREPFLAAWRDEHQRYDKETNHAKDKARQRGWRKKLDEQLELVARERAAVAAQRANPRNPR